MQLSGIRTSSQFVLSGDANNIGLYAHPYGTNTHSLEDCDKDDALGRCLIFWPEVGSTRPHRVGCNVLFADGHVVPIKKFDSTLMTYDPHEPGIDWNDVQKP